MVDLAFLLITFFMLTTSLTTPTSMDLVLPEQKGKPLLVDQFRTMTLLIGENDQLKYYMGRLTGNPPKDIAYGKNGLRKELAARKKEALAYSGANGHPGQGLIVLIKPGKKSNYRNLVDVLDEMAISEIQTYAITDMLTEESKLITNRVSALPKP